MARNGKAWRPTHPDKLFWPQSGISKADLIAYYGQVASSLLPFLENRPVSMKRYPEGISGESFFQKNLRDERLPAFVKTCMVRAKTTGKNVRYALCNNQETLAYLANIGALELHPWGSRKGSLGKPDVMVFDLDPGEKTSFGDVIEAALFIKKLLDARKMPSFVKTSGKRGLHVYVPLRPGFSYGKVRAAARALAEEAVRGKPGLLSLEVHPAKRKDKIFIDYLRNAEGQTAVAPYSTRATPEATVSTPLEWREVARGLDPKRFTVKTVPSRLKKKGDPWKRMFKKAVGL
jgi:bifunctional non-homologous end joining protein LigD